MIVHTEMSAAALKGKMVSSFVELQLCNTMLLNFVACGYIGCIGRLH